ncbi:MAG: tetratricopeptide repeat protein [Lysobacteraceae bacterium]|nr:MAG: tetratricopeptide repeat protein [Xanthomonadaceae bacterium]
MKEALSFHWKAALRHEAAGDLPAAKAAYEAMLDIEPLQVVPQLRLSRFAQIEDRYLASRAHALRASRTASATRATKDVGFVSLRLLAFAEEAEVGRLIKSLDWTDVEVLKQAAVLAQHLWLTGHHEEALAFLTRVGAKVRPSHLLSHTRANVLRSLGRLQEATEHYEYALQLNPHDANTHRALAYHQQSIPPGARVERVRAAQRHHPADSSEQAHLCYALFKELDGVGDIPGAWAALTRGAGLVQQRLDHDPLVEARQFERLTQASPTPLTGTLPDYQGTATPIFIVGMPRTGTTLLDRILGNRTDVVSVGERNDFAASVSEASDHFFVGGLSESRWEKLEGMDFQRAGSIYLARLGELVGDRRFFIDKNPQNFFNIGLILRALPHARILCLQRDPMDTCFSNLKELFEGGAYPYSYSMEGLAAHYRGFVGLLDHWKATAAGSVHVVRYEDLVSQDEATLGEILRFCGMEDAPGMFEVTANASPVSTASSSQVRQPINELGLNAWKRYAGPLEPLRKMMDAIAS